MWDDLQIILRERDMSVVGVFLRSMENVFWTEQCEKSETRRKWTPGLAVWLLVLPVTFVGLPIWVV